MAWKPDQLIVLDFETTGFATDEHARPIEVALVALDSKNEIVDSYSSLIHPWQTKGGPQYIELDGDSQTYEWAPLSQGAANVHKIPAGECITAPEAAVVCLEIRRWLATVKQSDLGRQTLISDNAFFDMTFMHRLFGQDESAGAFPFHYGCRDTVHASALFKLFKKKFFTAGETAHRALDDAMALARLIKAAAERA